MPPAGMTAPLALMAWMPAPTPMVAVGNWAVVSMAAVATAPSAAPGEPEM